MCKTNVEDTDATKQYLNEEVKRNLNQRPYFYEYNILYWVSFLFFMFLEIITEHERTGGRATFGVDFKFKL